MSGRLYGVGLLLGLASLAAACGPTADVPPQVYEVAGEVYQLPDPNRSPRQIFLRHEAIPDFVGADGEVVGMDAMTMPFRLADDVSVEGLEPGDRVRFTLEVHWSGPPTRVTRLEPLPPATEADAATPPAEGTTDSGVPAEETGEATG